MKIKPILKVNETAAYRQKEKEMKENMDWMLAQMREGLEKIRKSREDYEAHEKNRVA